MSERLVSYDPYTGLQVWHSYDPMTDATTIRTVGDCEPVLEMNKRMANDTAFTKEGIGRDFWLYARIPAAIQVKWLIEDGIDIWNKHHGPRISRKLEDPEWKYLKTTTRHHKFK